MNKRRPSMSVVVAAMIIWTAANWITYVNTEDSRFNDPDTISNDEVHCFIPRADNITISEVLSVHYAYFRNMFGPSEVLPTVGGYLQDVFIWIWSKLPTFLDFVVFYLMLFVVKISTCVQDLASFIFNYLFNIYYRAAQES